MPSLNGTLALAEVDQIPFHIAENLNLDVPRILDPFLNVHRTIAEGTQRFARSITQRCLQVLGTINATAETVLAPGMVFCVETPYYEHGWGGVQVEDAVEITATGVRQLTRSSQELHILG